MDKKENSLLLGLKLLLITACAGLILGFVYNITKEPIAKQTKKTNDEAMQELITKADAFSKVDIKAPKNILEVNEAKSGDSSLGYTIKISTKGYGGPIELMVGISNEGNVEGIKILSQSETPGLGAESTKPEFQERFKGKSIDKDLEVVKNGASNPNEIQALSGATITSKAVTKGVNDAVKFYNEQLKGGQK